MTRFRRKFLTKGIASFFKIKLEEVRQYYPDWYIETVGTDLDHVHLHIGFPPKYSGSFVVETIKKNTSRELKAHFPFFKKLYWDDGGIWAVGYFFSTVGINEEVIRKYVEMQGAEDAGQAQLEF